MVTTRMLVSSGTTIIAMSVISCTTVTILPNILALNTAGRSVGIILATMNPAAVAKSRVRKMKILTGGEPALYQVGRNRNQNENAISERIE